MAFDYHDFEERPCVTTQLACNDSWLSYHLGQWLCVVAKYGNTSASSIGIALDELSRNNKIKDRENILFTAFGAGFTWASGIITKRENL